MPDRHSYRLLSRYFVMLLLCGILAGNAYAEPTDDSDATADGAVQAVIRARLTGENAVRGLDCQGEMICGIRLLPQAYAKNDFRPLWNADAQHHETADALIAVIANADTDGLDPADYHLSAIRAMMVATIEASSIGLGPSAERQADLDLMLTDAFLLYGSHLAAGRVNPETLHADWIIRPGNVDLLAALERATRQGEVAAALAALRPPYPEYHALRQALTRLRAQAASGGWPVIPSGKTLRPGDRNPTVVLLRRRLIDGGDSDIPVPEADPLLFDDRLAADVAQRQRRYGLTADGIVGRNTCRELNIPVEARIRQVILNLERCRWLPRDLGERHLIVNTADFRLKAVERGRTVLEMRVVVGRPARRSPVFSARMRYLVLNPFWNVPTTIAVEDILPQLLKDDSYLARHGIHLFASWRDDAAEVDPASVDWRAYGTDRFPFRLRQDPGPANALGRIKFMFPNPFAVYLHDTPNHANFSRTQRDLSSGCIRVESPLDLARFALADEENDPARHLAEWLASGETRTVFIHRPLWVHLLYMTAFADDDGRIQFRRDIYDRDRDLQRAIDRRRAFPAPAVAVNAVSPPASIEKGFVPINNQ